MENEVLLVKLHENEDLIENVVDLLNSEWPRSKESRYHSLKASNNNLPCSLVMVEGSSGDVWSFATVSRVHGCEKAVFLENVIVPKFKRGCGLGRLLMEQTEEFTFSLGFTKIFLSTHDKYQFYKHLGYKDSHPVSPLKANASLLTQEQFAALHSIFGEKPKKGNGTEGRDERKQEPKREEKDVNNYAAKENKGLLKQADPNAEGRNIAPLIQTVSPAPPTPPPPPPVVTRTLPENQQIHWMTKELHAPGK